MLGTNVNTFSFGRTEILDIGSLVAGRTESAVSGVFNDIKLYVM